VNVTNFPHLASIYAMFDTLSTATNVYDISASGTGRFAQTITISPTNADDFPGDNTATTSFYLTDSLYSKGLYDFTKNAPVCALYEHPSSGTEFLWGPVYTVKTGGASVSRIQYSLSKGTAGILDAGFNNVYLFKWVDGARDQPADKVVQNGELELVGLAVKNYDVSTGSADTSDAILNVTGMNIDTLKGVSPTFVTLESNSTYYLAIDVPAGYYLACDGTTDALPRTYGRFYNTNSYLEYNNILMGGTIDDYHAAFSANNAVMPFSGTSYIQSIDSFAYNQTKGIIPSVAMIVNNNPGAPIIDKTGVNTIPQSVIGVTVSPNPAKDFLTVSVDLDKTSPTVTYTVIDGLARFVTKEVHNNVKNEKATINTSNFAAGNYFLIVNANGTATSRKFTVIK